MLHSWQEHVAISAHVETVLVCMIALSHPLQACSAPLCAAECTTVVSWCLQVHLPCVWACDGCVCGANIHGLQPHDHSLHKEQAQPPTKAGPAGNHAQGGLLCHLLMVLLGSCINKGVCVRVEERESVCVCVVLWVRWCVCVY